MNDANYRLIMLVDSMDLVGDVKDCDCIIVDDMIDSTGTFDNSRAKGGILNSVKHHNTCG